MSREYIFNHYSSLIDIEKENYKPVLESRWKSFLWDNNVKGITLRQDVSTDGNVNEYRMVKIRLAIIKDKDYLEFKETVSIYNYWEYTNGKMSSTIKIDESSYQKILELYSKASKNHLLKLSKKSSNKLIYTTLCL